MIIQAAPPGVKAHVVPIDKMISVAKDPRFGATKALLLFETPQGRPKSNPGWCGYQNIKCRFHGTFTGKVAVTKALAFDKDDVKTMREIEKLGVKFDVRKFRLTVRKYGCDH